MSHIPASTVTGLASELTVGRQALINTQASLGVRAGCQLWERFFALFPGVGEVGLYIFFGGVGGSWIKAYRADVCLF